ncbi:MAG: YceI family protein [Lentimicrobium sp.]|nr:YceI family protein [Lentimicrobium sp.]
MTKFRKLLGLVVIAGFIASCGGPQGEKAKTGEAQEVSVKSGEITINVDLQTSNVEWVGTKPTGKHNGTISLSSGELMLTDGSIVGGKFMIDMNSIVNLDLTDEESNGKLVGHLKSEDFFEVESYPTSVFEITSVAVLEGNADATHNITGNLTMKDVTKSITFPAMVTISDSGVSASSPAFIIDRVQWNVKYGSKSLFANLKDNFINDEISLSINLNAGI